MNDDAIHELTNFVENGPLAADTFIASDTILSLIRDGYLARIVVHGDDGWLAATSKGAKEYTKYHGTSLGGTADTLNEAYAYRITQQTLKGINKK